MVLYYSQYLQVRLIQCKGEFLCGLHFCVYFRFQLLTGEKKDTKKKVIVF